MMVLWGWIDKQSGFNSKLCGQYALVCDVPARGAVLYCQMVQWDRKELAQGRSSCIVGRESNECVNNCTAEWEQSPINAQRIRAIWHKNNEGGPEKHIKNCCKHCVKLNTIGAPGLLQSVDSTIRLHRYTHLLSRHVISLNGKVNILVTY